MKNVKNRNGDGECISEGHDKNDLRLVADMKRTEGEGIVDNEIVLEGVNSRYEIGGLCQIWRANLKRTILFKMVQCIGEKYNEFPEHLNSEVRRVLKTGSLLVCRGENDRKLLVSKVHLLNWTRKNRENLGEELAFIHSMECIFSIRGLNQTLDFVFLRRSTNKEVDYIVDLVAFA